MDNKLSIYETMAAILTQTSAVSTVGKVVTFENADIKSELDEPEDNDLLDFSFGE